MADASSVPAAPLPPTRSVWGPLAAAALVVADVVWAAPVSGLLTALAVLLLVATARRARRRLAALSALLVILQAAAAIHLHVQAARWPRWAEARAQARLAAVEKRARALVERLQAQAASVAALAHTRGAVAGDRGALVRLFDELEARAGGGDPAPSLAVDAIPLRPIAWAGRTADPAVLEGLVGDRADVFVLGGTVTTTLVASAPVHGANGAWAGVATVALPIAVRRNVRNEYLHDYDLLAGDEGGVEFRYVDARGESEGPRPFEHPAPGVFFRDGILRSPDGGVLAAVRAIVPPPEEARRALEALYRRLLSLAAAILLVVWAVGDRQERGWRAWRWAAAAIACRLLFVYVPPAFPLLSSELVSPDTYASARLGPLLISPIDLLLTAIALLALAAVAFDGARHIRPRRPSLLRMAGAAVLAIPILAGALRLIEDTVVNCSLDLTVLPLLPRSAAHLAIHVALLAVTAAGALGVASVLTLGGPAPLARDRRIAAVFVLAALVTTGVRYWPGGHEDMPVLAVFLLFALTLGAALEAQAAQERLRALRPGAVAALVLLGVAALVALLYPTLVHDTQQTLRKQIERDYAPLVLRQPEWRQYALQETERAIDAMNLLEDAPPGIYHPGIEELAFAVWSATDLSGYGFSSAVEIQDVSGTVISRFALNLPSIASRERRLPQAAEWMVSREPVSLASTETLVLHAQRLLTYHGDPHGAIHVYVGEDFWSLPFVQGRDPYSVLYRNTARGGLPDRPVTLLVYDTHRDVAFSSAERPPALDPALSARALEARRRGEGVWTTLEVDGLPQHAYVFATADLVYALTYRRLSPGRYAADLVEAVSAFTLLGVLVLVLVVLARSVLRRPSLSLPSLFAAVGRRFALRLFVAFTLVAFVPAAVLQVVVSGFVTARLRKESDDQALERASVAKKAVEDYAFFQREEATGPESVTDAALVWLASVVKNDLDLFEQGHLVASSKRELYASGLLAPRVSGSVYRAIVLEGQPSTLQTERIGDFSYLVASVPVHVGGHEHGVLSMPLALRQREVEATVDDLDRTIRLASVLFLGLAAGIALSMARRISGPIQELTRATRRIAQGDLEARVEATSQDELRRLVEAFNQMARDLHAQRRDLERSNRLAAWADMARQVAHEVKNPLTPIQLSAEHLRRVFADRSEDFARTLETCTDTILKQVRTLRGIVTEFSAFARPPADELSAQDPRAMLEEVIRPYQAGLPPRVDLTLDLDGAAPAVRADRRLLERALVNLLENALQAVGEAGSIRVSLRTRDEGRRVEIEVRDSGPGVAPEARDRIFEPFFSTKTSGSGLGLALVKKIAEDHGGGVSLESTPGEPTRALLWLPAAPRE
jgi:two-component system, NtrC family, nitrogen regulation sensor histidine kinase NtrY